MKKMKKAITSFTARINSGSFWELFLFLLPVLVAWLAAFSAFSARAAGTEFQDSLLLTVDSVRIGKFSAILLALVQLAKSPILGSVLLRFNQKLIPYLTLFVAVGGLVGLAMNEGRPLAPAVIEGILVALNSNIAYETIRGIASRPKPMFDSKSKRKGS